MGVLAENPLIKLNEEDGTEVLPGLRIKADGTVVRNSDRASPTTDPSVSPSPIFVDNVASKDVIVDSETGIWSRVFLPESVSEGLSKKLPIVVYFHGGGFCIGNAGDAYSSHTATGLCKTANVVVISASYRLSPESRLPTAFNDAYTTMSWLQKQCKYQASGDNTAADPWLMNHVDFSQVFVMGGSAGGNIAHHVVVSKPLKDFHPLTIAGVIPVVPFFSAEELSESEQKFPEDEILPLDKHHTFWRLALPVGANRAHPYCNPLSADAQRLSEVQIPRMLLIVAGKDPLYTRQMEYYNALKQAGKEVQLVEVPEGTHAFRIVAALEVENVRVDQTSFTRLALLRPLALFICSLAPRNRSVQKVHAQCLDDVSIQEFDFWSQTSCSTEVHRYCLTKTIWFLDSQISLRTKIHKYCLTEII